MHSWSIAPLGELAKIERSGISPTAIRDGIMYVGLEHIGSDGRIEGAGPIRNGDLGSQKFIFTKDHILYGKLRPYLAKITCPDFDGICSTDILPIRPGPRMEKCFLLHFLRQPSQVAKIASLATGANLPRVSPNVLARQMIPVPPISEQRRIATVLDKADTLRRNRSSAAELVFEIRAAIFKKIFETSFHKPPVRLIDRLSLPLRNGVSPSNSGKTRAHVLTLSAVTGESFNSAAAKEATFDFLPPPGKRVSSLDLLICRGNGNLGLVGKGYFPRADMPETAFPDTMIAARVDPAKINTRFLEHLWQTRLVRGQIESLARTTNGTFKVNQQMLESIELPDPPMELQEEFAARMQDLDRLSSTMHRSTSQLDALFASLQHRAFAGEL